MVAASPLLVPRRFLFYLLSNTYLHMGDMSSKTQLPSKEGALPGRSEKMRVSAQHLSGIRSALGPVFIPHSRRNDLSHLSVPMKQYKSALFVSNTFPAGVKTGASGMNVTVRKNYYFP
uniref:Uncharacterized protein n=1 Tax=Xenopus tropicalis TaxID=8364 RepID=A0A1B8YB02_XENTR